MRLRQAILILLLVVPGTTCFAICLYYALLDWAALQHSYAAFARIADTPGDLRAVFVAEAKQNIHRINLFADGVWALLGAVVVALGLHGLCLLPTRTLVARTSQKMRREKCLEP